MNGVQNGAAYAAPTTPPVLALPAPSGLPHYGCRCVPGVGAVCPAHGYALNQGSGECICPDASPVHTVECQKDSWDHWQNDFAIEAQEPMRCAGCPTPFYEVCSAECCNGVAKATPTAPVRVGNTWRPNTTVTAIQVYRACREIDVMCLACHAATGACAWQGRAEQSVCDCGMVHCGGCEPQVCEHMEYQHAAGGYWRQGSADRGNGGAA